MKYIAKIEDFFFMENTNQNYMIVLYLWTVRQKKKCNHIKFKGVFSFYKGSNNTILQLKF
jgi:hypothetical protein